MTFFKGFIVTFSFRTKFKEEIGFECYGSQILKLVLRII